MQSRFAHWINTILTITSQQLQLCCHREVGNLPTDMIRPQDLRSGRLR